MNFEFKSIIADFDGKSFENANYLPFVIGVFNQYKRVLVDDYYPKEEQLVVKHIIDEINTLYPWFMVITLEQKPIGCVWASHWHGNAEKIHSCQIHFFMHKKYWGNITMQATLALLDILFNQYKIERVQIEVPDFNAKAIAFAKRIGFKQEGIVRCATIKDGKPLDHLLFSLLRTEYSES